MSHPLKFGEREKESNKSFCGFCGNGGRTIIPPWTEQSHHDLWGCLPLSLQYLVHQLLGSSHLSTRYDSPLTTNPKRWRLTSQNKKRSQLNCSNIVLSSHVAFIMQIPKNYPRKHHRQDHTRKCRLCLSVSIVHTTRCPTTFCYPRTPNTSQPRDLFLCILW